MQTKDGIEKEYDDNGVIVDSEQMDVDEDAPMKEVEVIAHPV